MSGKAAACVAAKLFGCVAARLRGNDPILRSKERALPETLPERRCPQGLHRASLSTPYTTRTVVAQSMAGSTSRQTSPPD
jgi:hypothetical protein